MGNKEILYETSIMSAKYIFLFVLTAGLFCFGASSDVLAKSVKNTEKSQKEVQKLSLKYENGETEEIKDAKNAEKQDSEKTLKGNAAIYIQSNNVDYIQGSDSFVATGDVKIFVESSQTYIEADKVTYDREKAIIVAEKNVKITKRGQVIYGDFARMDLNKDSVLIDNLTTAVTKIKVDAKTANIYPKKGDPDKKDIDLANGKATLSDPNATYMLSRSGSKFLKSQELEMLNRAKQSKAFKQTYKIHSKEIFVKRKKETDIITFKNADVYSGKFKIAKIPSLTMAADKDSQWVETTFPEIGQKPDLGWYYGWGPIFTLPSGAALKLAPTLTVGDGVGIGTLSRFTSDTNRTELGYSSRKKKIVLEGEQKLPFISEATKIQYGMNHYISNGILGGQKPNKIFELVDERTLARIMSHKFDLRSSAGYLENENRWGTGRYQLQGNLYTEKPLINLFGNHLGLGTSSQFSTSVYGNGETYGILRGGPSLTTSFGHWYTLATYYQGGVWGKTPFRFDEYYYGKQNIDLNSHIALTRFMTFGYRGSYNLSKDNYDKKMLAENQFYLLVGPDDLKLRLGYDTRRKATVFDFTMLIGADRSSIYFDKMKIREN